MPIAPRVRRTRERLPSDGCIESELPRSRLTGTVVPFASDTALTSAGHNRQAHLKRAHLGLMMLTDRKDIAIWIFEPPYLVTRGSRPNSKLTILNEGVLFQDIAFVPEPSDHGFDIFYFPAQDRTLQCSEIRDFCDPNLVPSDAHDQCVLIDAYKLKSEISFIEARAYLPCYGYSKKMRWSGQELLHPEATDKTKVPLSRAG